MMKTQAFPYKEIALNTYEIGEFDCASIFLLVGDERAMVIDTGVGIGDLKGFIEWGPQPPLSPLEDEQIIDLGNRKVTVYACPGHTAGSITFLDEASRSLIMGDACNCNLGLGGGAPGTPRFVSIEEALSYLKRLQSLRDRYDRYYNGHYDFRPLGEPLGEDVLPDAITACEQILAGTAVVEVKPSQFPNAPIRSIVKIGRTNVSFNPDGIRG